MKDKERFGINFYALCTLYNREMETVLIDAWWRSCDALTDDQFEWATQQLMKETEYFPTPAQVRARSYQRKEELDVQMGRDSGIVGVPLLEKGEPVVTNQREGVKYATDPIHAPLYYCLTCKDRNHVRVDVDSGTPHFGKAIPCPHCHDEEYDRYCLKNGVPPTMPKFGGGFARAA